MAETQNAPSTVEVNDAIFCAHFNEVVRSDLPDHKLYLECQLLIVYQLWL